jgi:predicted transcriptional regulator of viral defense system
MAAIKHRSEQILELARQAGIVSAREVRELGIHSEYLRRLCADGRLVRVGRGLYVLPDAEVTPQHSLAMAAKAVPRGVICLLSALSFHSIGTQVPHEVWMAIDRRSAEPRVERPMVRIMRFSGKALTEGIQQHTVEGVGVNVYGPAKTVADCFKYRNKVGLDVALEALREVLRDRKCTLDGLWRFANVCRVGQVMRPYLEALA